MEHISRRTGLALLGASPLAVRAGVRHAAAGPIGLRIGGTGMALAAMQELATQFSQREAAPRFDVLSSLGTGGGLAAVGDGAIDLALTARPPTDAERAKGLQSRPYARTPIAFVSRPPLAMQDISLDRVVDILTGTAASWPDGRPVRLIRRETSDADWKLFRSLSPRMEQAITTALQRPGLLTVATDQENADMLERLPGSFGAMTIGQLRAEKRNLAPFALQGVRPDVAEMESGRYPLSRTLYVVWRNPASAELKGFLAFVAGREGGDILSRLGHAPLPPDGHS